MNENWIDLNDLQAVAIAQSEGWEIECHGTSGSWCSWNSISWHTDLQYRGRPRQPKTREVKMECFLIDGELHWRDEKLSVLEHWIRQPHRDIVVEVPE